MLTWAPLHPLRAAMLSTRLQLQHMPIDPQWVGARVQVFDESNSPYTSANQAMYAANAPSGGLSSDDFGEFLQASGAVFPSASMKYAIQVSLEASA